MLLLTPLRKDENSKEKNSAFSLSVYPAPNTRASRELSALPREASLPFFLKTSKQKQPYSYISS